VASVRKRTWRTKTGQAKTGWMVDYVDQNGERQRKTFALKKSADAFALQAQLEVRDGTHVPDANSVTVSEAGKLWIQAAEMGDSDREPLEWTSVEQYKQHLELHIAPFIGKDKLSQLNVPAIGEFAGKLRDNGRSRTMVKYVLRSLGSLLADAQEHPESRTRTAQAETQAWSGSPRQLTQDRSGYSDAR
jgi:integrase